MKKKLETQIQHGQWMGNGAGGLKKFRTSISVFFCFPLDCCCNLESQWSMYWLMIIGVNWFQWFTAV